MNAVGIIFADSYDVDIDELMKTRTLASLPFGGRYRIIDFQLSNMANSGIRNIAIITTQRYQSLMDHVRAGDEWDLDRKTSQLKIIPPLSMEKAKSVYENRLEALQANIDYLSQAREKYVVITGCNYVANIDFQAMIDYHEKSGAAITGMCVKNPYNKEPDVEATVY
ncbi:MAG: sugar phosphate nucleotidyltransferase, partial [Anaerovoracaceae bacterium]